MTTTASVYTCPYCRQTSAGASASCPSCGAPVDIELRTTSGGWIELPPIADMARIQVGHSQVEVSGRTAPIADWSLGAGETVKFPHHVLVWKEPTVELSPMSMRRAWTRHRAGLPLVMLSAKGPGRIAFSHDRTGEALALPGVRPGQGQAQPLPGQGRRARRLGGDGPPDGPQVRGGWRPSPARERSPDPRPADSP